MFIHIKIIRLAELNSNPGQKIIHHREKLESLKDEIIHAGILREQNENDDKNS